MQLHDVAGAISESGKKEKMRLKMKEKSLERKLEYGTDFGEKVAYSNGNRVKIVLRQITSLGCSKDILEKSVLLKNVH